MPGRGLSLRPVHSVKNVVDIATTVILAVENLLPVVETVDAPTLGNPTQIETGATVKAIYLRVEAVATNQHSGVPRLYMGVYKNPSTQLGFPAVNSIGNDERKRFIFHQEMTMLAATLSGTDNFPRTVFQGVIKIPPRFRRFGHADNLYVLLQHGSGETTGITSACVQCIYKWFT